MKRKIVNLGLFFLLALGVSSAAFSAPDQGEDVQVVEFVYFSIERMPSDRTNGVIVLQIDESEGDDPAACSVCGVKLSFTTNLKIKIGGETSTMTLEHLSVLPRQRVTAEVLNGRVLSVGMVNVIRGKRYLNDI